MSTGDVDHVERPGDNQNATAARMAREVCRGFRAHDRGRRAEAIEAFSTVDRLQFKHLNTKAAKEAAQAYVDALFRKDEVEFAALQSSVSAGDDGHDESTNGSKSEDTNCPETDSPQAAYNCVDWAPVASKFRERAAIVGMNPAYAKQSTVGWRKHKSGGNYHEHLQRAQMYELRAAIGDQSYPDKPKHGQSGYGPEAARYTLAVELHDMHSENHWQQAVNVMIPYFNRILRGHRDD
ncbi:hypothetical protein RYH80_14990 [Halobaculum sp. MBLA0147]|uniref:hypothetical protein n=1 Tax=Halobaculum sp. MBLA0147 TaxID=3079934 RepID=UPI003525AD4A